MTPSRKSQRPTIGYEIKDKGMGPRRQKEKRKRNKRFPVKPSVGFSAGTSGVTRQGSEIPNC